MHNRTLVGAPLSFKVQLFNCLSRQLRGKGDTDNPNLLVNLNRELDTVKATIPDKPRLPGCLLALWSNSIITQVRRVGDGREGPS